MFRLNRSRVCSRIDLKCLQNIIFHFWLTDEPCGTVSAIAEPLVGFRMRMQSVFCGTIFPNEERKVDNGGL